MSDTEPVRYEERDDIAIITLNRPDKKNTLTDAVIQGVADGIDAAAASRDVAAIGVGGGGGTLTAGYDRPLRRATSKRAGRPRTAPRARHLARGRGTRFGTTSSWATMSAAS